MPKWGRKERIVLKKGRNKIEFIKKHKDKEQGVKGHWAGGKIPPHINNRSGRRMHPNKMPKQKTED